jgi:ABC-2 type transport system permease protein
LSLPGAILILFHIDILTGLVSAKTEASWGIRLAKEHLVLFFSGALIPFYFLPETIKNWFMMLPFQGICHTPLYLLSHPSISTSEFLKMLSIQLLWVLLLTLLVKYFINRLILNLEINGG